MLQSVDKTYNSFDHDFTLCLAKFNHNNLEVTDTTALNDNFTYIAFPFTALNLIALLFFFYVYTSYLPSPDTPHQFQ